MLGDDSDLKSAPSRRCPCRIFAVLAALFALSMFYRVSSAVIAQDLIRDLRLDLQELGTLGAAFFYSFALLQIPMGIMLDRVGPRLIMAGFSMTAAAGALVFGFSQTFLQALVGRILLGAGMASALMGALKVMVTAYPRERFSILSGTLISVGAVGSLLAASPLAWLSGVTGWRVAFVGSAVITALLSGAAFVVLRDAGGGMNRNTSPGEESAGKEGIRHVARLLRRNASFWCIAVLSFFRYGTVVALQGLWLGPYLVEIKGFTQAQVGTILTVMSVGIIAGLPVGGYLADRIDSPKKVAFIGLSLYTLCLLPLAGATAMRSVEAFSVLCFFMGFFTGFGSLVYTHVKDLFPLRVSGTATSGVNFFIMSGGAVVMQLVGMVVSLGNSGESPAGTGYQTSFRVCMAAMVVSLILYGFSREKPGRSSTGDEFGDSPVAGDRSA